MIKYYFVDKLYDQIEDFFQAQISIFLVQGNDKPIKLVEIKINQNDKNGDILQYIITFWAAAPVGDEVL